jgi:hypothetical protein
MSNIKFTSDGKKVAIVGKLNSQETIVQEIFVQGESEIPSGEHFVVKSLHDTPAVSWKESELKKLEERYRTDKEKFESEIKDAEKKYRAKTLELRKKLEYNLQRDQQRSNSVNSGTYRLCYWRNNACCNMGLPARNIDA